MLFLSCALFSLILFARFVHFSHWVCACVFFFSKRSQLSFIIHFSSCSFFTLGSLFRHYKFNAEFFSHRRCGRHCRRFVHSLSFVISHALVMYIQFGALFLSVWFRQRHNGDQTNVIVHRAQNAKAQTHTPVKWSKVPESSTKMVFIFMVKKEKKIFAMLSLHSYNIVCFFGKIWKNSLRAKKRTESK